MKTVHSLTFLWLPWSLVLSALVVLGTGALCWIAWRRSGYRRDLGVLELLRLVLVTLVVLLFNQPEWIEEHRSTERPTIAVLWDDSLSMQTRDVAVEGASTSVQTRRESIESLIQPEFWASLNARFDVVIQPFSSAEANGTASSGAAPPANPPPADPAAATEAGRPPVTVAVGTNLHQPLATAPQRFPHLRAIVLASDGDWNEGPAPALAASTLRLKDIPVYPIPAGSANRLPDVELLTLDAPTFGVTGKSVRIPFSIESTLPRDFTATVTLKTSQGEDVTKEIRIAAMGRTNDWLVWQPDGPGDVTLTLTVPRQAEELLADNNQITAPISIRDEKLRVLVVESIPRWEYRYLRNALSRDPGVEVSCLLFHPGLTKPGGGNKDYIKQFPRGLEELSKFDVVFLGDVGLEDGQLTAEDCRLLKGLVEHQASGLVFMPGWQGRQLSLLETELNDLYPVQLDPAQPEGWGSRTPSHFELTELGRRSLLTKLADTQEENLDVWEDLPGFQWHAAVTRARAGSEVLCVHADSSSEFGRVPLLATRTYGAGKVLFMGTDGAWRWRKGVEDKYHYRFWGQVVRWMAYQRNMAKGETMRMYYSPEQPQVRQTLALTANVMERSGEPLARGDVTARIVAPSGKAEVVRFNSTGGEWGEFTARFLAEEPGRHDVMLTCPQTESQLEASFFVQGTARERIGRAARPEVLQEIATITRGQMSSRDRLESVLTSLAALPDPPPTIRRVQLWSHPVVAGVLIALLGAFWVARKVVGLI